MKSCTVMSEWNAFRPDSTRIVQVKVTEFCSTSNCRLCTIEKLLWTMKDNTSKRPVCEVWIITWNSHTGDKWICGNNENNWIRYTKEERQAQQHFQRGRKHEACEHSREQQLKDRECPELVCLWCLFSVVLVCCTVPCIHDWSHCGSSLCFVSSSSPFLMRTLSDSLSDLSIYLTFLLFIPFLSSCTSFCFTPSSSLMSWTTTTRTAAEELGPPHNKNSSTGFAPNDHFITDAHVEFTQESVTKQRFFEDFDYDDITINQTLLNARRRWADHSEGEGLSSCLSSSSIVMIERWDPLFAGTQVTCKVTKFRRKNSESETDKDSPGPTKGANPRWLPSGDPKRRTPGLLRLKKYT